VWGVSRLLVTVALLLTACPAAKPSATKRVTLLRTGGTTFELVPEEDQFPYCLAYTVSRSGLTRQLTMSPSNNSWMCPAGGPIGHHAFKVPVNEGPVRVYVLFTTQPVTAGAVSQQLLDASDRQHINVMDLRLPGNAALESLDFVPEEDVAPTEGERLHDADAGVEPAHGGGGASATRRAREIASRKRAVSKTATAAARPRHFGVSRRRASVIAAPTKRAQAASSATPWASAKTVRGARRTPIASTRRCIATLAVGSACRRAAARPTCSVS
jgi:hypothetical protein